MRQMVEIKHDGIESTGLVPVTALERVKKHGWKVVGDEPVDPADLKGKELEEALESAGLDKTGTADEKRQRLAEHLASQA